MMGYEGEGLTLARTLVKNEGQIVLRRLDSSLCSHPPLEHRHLAAPLRPGVPCPIRLAEKILFPYPAFCDELIERNSDRTASCNLGRRPRSRCLSVLNIRKVIIRLEGRPLADGRLKMRSRELQVSTG